MLNTNAAFLASELSKQGYFDRDDQGMVWDQNKPFLVGDSINIPFIISHSKIVNNIKIQLFKKEIIKNPIEAEKEIHTAHRKGYHIICGNSFHSLLTAGHKDKSYFFWDPDTSNHESETEAIRKNLNGEYNTFWLFDNYDEGKGLDFWTYRIKAHNEVIQPG
ncbi:hypothetical protein HHA04nite_29000 [Halomonas halophila]|uniref:Peptidase C39-like domain-containing protein n=2 Tax=Halomonadaceae TaxID=28256 RepID=A0ABQ0U779_9GAMM|nr:hypothetical protein HHA04nite_29000 [Halomonas halophila]